VFVALSSLAVFNSLKVCPSVFICVCLKVSINDQSVSEQDVFALLIAPVVDKSGTSCYHLVTRLMRPTDSQQVVPTSLISSARNKLLTS
jgi:hypothetical protein